MSKFFLRITFSFWGIFLFSIAPLEAQPIETKEEFRPQYYEESLFLVKVAKKRLKRALSKIERLNAPVSIISMTISEELEYALREIALLRIEAITFSTFKRFNLIQHREALNTRAEEIDGKVYISRGATTDKKLEQFLREADTPFYMEAALTKDKRILRLLITIYSRENKGAIWSTQAAIRLPLPKDLTFRFGGGKRFELNNASLGPFLISTFIGERFVGLGEAGIVMEIGFAVDPDIIGDPMLQQQDNLFGFRDFELNFLGEVSFNMSELFSRPSGVFSAYLFIDLGLKLVVSPDPQTQETGFTPQLGWAIGLRFLMGSLFYLQVETASGIETSLLTWGVQGGFYF